MNWSFYFEESKIDFFNFKFLRLRDDLKSDSTMLKKLMQSANQGDAAALCLLAKIYDGEGAASQAFEYFFASAQAGFKYAQHDVATYYHSGNVVTQNIDTAIKWYTKAAKQHSAHAMLKLALLYDSDEYIPKNDVLAVFWYEKAASEGNAYAQYNLAYNYENGIAVSKNFNKAIQLRKEAAKSGFQPAINWCKSNGYY